MMPFETQDVLNLFQSEEFFSPEQLERRLVQEDEDFAFLSGRIRALESQLIPQNVWEQLTDRQDLEAVDKVLNEAAYPKADTIYQRLDLEKNRLRSFVKQDCPNIFIEEALLLQEFYQNAKAMLKYFLGQSLDFTTESLSLPAFLKDLLYEREDVSALWQAIAHQKTLLTETDYFAYLDKIADLTAEEKYELFAFSEDKLPKALMKRALISPFVVQTIAYIKYEYTQNRSMGFVDVFLDRAYVKHLKALADFSQDIFLKDFVSYKIDLANQKVLARLRNFNLSLEQARAYYLPEGHLSLEAFEEEFLKGKSVLPQEEKAFLDYLQVAKRSLYGSQIFIAYVEAKQIELQNFRILVSMMAQKKSAEEIKAKLRGAYFDK